MSGDEIYLSGDIVPPFQKSLRHMLQHVMDEFGSQTCAVHLLTGEEKTYNDLKSAVKLLSLRLRKGSRVGICLTVSFESIVAVAACIMSGCCYVPLEPSLPMSRLVSMCRDAGLDTIIGQTEEPVVRKDLSVDWINIKSLHDREVNGFDCNNNEDNAINLNGETIRDGMTNGVKDRLFAILYTSGSTGEPKGVLIPESAVLNRLNWYWRRFPYEEKEVCAMRTPLSFVDSICEMLSPLLKGAAIAIVPKTLLLDPVLLVRTLEAHSVSRIVLIPSLLNLVLDFIDVPATSFLGFPSSLKLVTTSGEELTSCVASKFFAKTMNPVTLLNMYGCTEVMADVTCQAFTCLEDVEKYSLNDRLSIGSPIDNTTVIVTTDVTSDDGTYELIISGSNVAHGYHSNEQQDSRFFRHIQHGRCFRTGDRVMVYHSEGKTEKPVMIYMGRNDTQCKINSQRFDMREVEHVMKNKFDVEAVTVFDAERQKILAFLPHDSFHRIVNLDSMKNFLPAYAVPEVVNIGLRAFPVLPSSGKIDRQALMQIYHQQQDNRLAVSSTWLEDLEEQELPAFVDKLKILLRVMDEAWIKYRPSCLQDLKENTFFTIGGSSLNAIFVVSRLAMNGLHVSVPDFVGSSSLFDLAKSLSIHDEVSPHNDLLTSATFDQKYEFVPVTLADEEAIVQFISRSFDQAERIYLSLHQNEPFLRKLLHDDFCYFIHTIFAGSVKSNTSYAVHQKKTKKMVGVFLNILESDVRPDMYYEYQHENWAVKAIVSLLVFLEKPILDRLKGKTKYDKILMAMLTCVDLDHLQSYGERVSLMFEMEKKVIVSAMEAGVQVIITTNTSQVTQDAADLLGYETQGVVYLKDYIDPETQSHPFHGAKGIESSKTSVKFLT